MKWLQLLDELIINFLELKVFHPLQRLTGKDNFHWAALFISAYAGLTIIDVWWFDEPHWALRIPQGLYFAFSLVYVLFLYSRFEYKSIRWLAQGGHNPYKHDPLLRIVRPLPIVIKAIFFVLSLFIFLWFGKRKTVDQEYILSELKGFLGVLFFYAIACDPLPPCSGKIGKWLAKLLGRPVEDL